MPIVTSQYQHIKSLAEKPQTQRFLFVQMLCFDTFAPAWDGVLLTTTLSSPNNYLNLIICPCGPLFDYALPFELIHEPAQLVISQLIRN